MRLEGKVAIITGASSGIGRGVAGELDRAGSLLVLNGRRMDRLEELAGELSDAVAVAGYPTDFDISNQLIEAAVDRLVDLTWSSTTPASWTRRRSRVPTSTVCAPTFASTSRPRRAWPTRHSSSSRPREAAYLINTSSILGTKVRPTAGVYAGSKYGIEALTEALRIEVAGSGVRVSCLEPGLVNTELQDHFEVHPRDMLGMQKPLDPG